MNLAQYDRLNALLLEVPRLVGLFEERDFAFVSETMKWLAEVVMVMKVADLGAVAGISALRGEILAAERGTPISSLSFSPRTSKKKALHAITVHALGEAQATLGALTTRAEEPLTQSRRVLSGLLANAGRMGMLDESIQPPFEAEILTGLWARIVADEDLGPSASQVLALIGFGDTMVLLRRILQSWAQDQRKLTPHPA